MFNKLSTWIYATAVKYNCHAITFFWAVLMVVGCSLLWINK
jgi:hypothetical protein